MDEFPDKCELCGESVTQLDIEHGNVAEMYDPKDPIGSSVICHTTCGQNKNLQVA